MIYRCNNCNSWFEEPTICYKMNDFICDPQMYDEYEGCPYCESPNFEEDEELEEVYNVGRAQGKVDIIGNLHTVVRMAKQHNATTDQIINMLKEVAKKNGKII